MRNLIPLLMLSLLVAPALSAEPAGVELLLSRSYMTLGDELSLNARVWNHLAPRSAELVVALEVHGEIWFWPSWHRYQGAQADSLSLALATGERSYQVIPPTPWPDLGSESSLGLHFYAALLPEAMDRIIGELDVVEWGYGPAQAGLEILPEATLPAGPDGPGSWILPSGRRITPLGDLVEVDSLPLSLVAAPDGSCLIAVNAGPDQNSLTVIDLTTGERTQILPEESLYGGICLNPDGNRLFVAGGGQDRVLVYQLEEGRLQRLTAWDVPGFPAALEVSPDGALLYVVSSMDGTVRVLDQGTGELLGDLRTGPDPADIALSPDGSRGYISLMREDQVDVLDLSDPAQPTSLGRVGTQKNPEGLQVSADGAILYVANADEDSLTLVDTVSQEVLRHVDLRPLYETEYGSSPNALAFAPDGSRLYIALAGDNAVLVVGLPDLGILGAVPTAWYPTAVIPDALGDRLLVACGKGASIGPSGSQALHVELPGAIQIAPLPIDSELERLWDEVQSNNHLPGRLFSIDESVFVNPVPLERGGPTPIRHVLFVIRENKTYDAILGDWPPGDGAPGNCLFCGDPVINLRALANRFASCDNYYSNAEASVQGHELMTAATVNTYVEKQWPAEGRDRPIQLDLFLNPASYPKKEFIFQNCLREGVSFRDYGEAVGVGMDWLILDQEYVHWGPKDPPFFFLYSKDVDKMAERIEEWESGTFPQLLFMLLPNDHNLGFDYPNPSPRSMVADNDEATGLLLDWLSHSRYWAESVVFVVEDDPQQGRDHVERHRTVLLTAGPWVKRGYVSPVHYSEGSLHATIEHILGLPPLTVHDSIAQPMWDLFTMKPDFEPFTHLPRVVPEEFNPPGTRWGRASRELNFLEPDEAVGLQELTWDHQRSRERHSGEEPMLDEAARRWVAEWFELGHWIESTRAEEQP